jgi:hypothetical protein
MIAGSLEIQLLANMARLQKDMDDAKRTVGGAMDSIERSIGLAKSAFAGLAAGMAAGLSVAAFVGVIKSSIDAAAKLNDLSIQTGATVEALSALVEIGKLSDISAGQIGGAMNKLAKNMAGATEDAKGAGKALEAIGLRFDDFKKLDPTQQMQAIAKAMDQFGDGSGKAAVAMALYGKEGAALLPFLKDLAVAGHLQATTTTEQAAMADNFSDNLIKIRVSGSAWGKELTHGILPAMSDLSDAWLDAMNGSGGLRETIRKLATDGTLDNWARMAVTALTYLMDVGQGLISIFPMIGKAIAGQVAATTIGFGAIYDAWIKFQNFDLDGAWAALKGGIAGVKSVATDTATDIAGIWNQEMLGEKIRKNMEEARKAREEAGKDANKPNLDFTNTNGKDKAAEAAKKELDEQAKLLAKLSGVNADYMEQLTRLQVIRDKGRLTEEQYIEAVKELIAVQPGAKKAMEEQAKATKLVDDANADASKAYSKFYDDLIQGTDKLKADTQAQQDHNDRLGLSKEAVAALDAAKLEEQATTLEGIAIKRLDKDLDEGVYNLYKSQAEELRKLAKLKQEGAGKESLIEEHKKVAEEEKKIVDNLRENLQRNLGDELFNMMDGNFENIGDSFKRMLMRMLADAAAADLMNALTGNGGGGSGVFGSLLQAGLSLWAGGGKLEVDTNGMGIGEIGSNNFSATGADVLARRAAGGPVGAGGLYEVNELGPELLSVGNRDYLMMGSQGGTVTPNSAIGGSQITITSAPVIHIDSRSDQAQVKRMVLQAVQQGNAELVDKLQRAGKV